MGNLIKDFWVYQYKSREYYGIVEIVGGPVEYNRSSIEKKETRIEKALAYMLTPGLRFFSHMSIQSYNQYLNKTGRSKRDDNEESFYPMYFELEPSKDGAKEEYREMVVETFKLVTYLTSDLGLDEKDVLIMLNNSRSLYVMINPVTYNLKPGANLHKIYKEIYSEINKTLKLKYIDEKMYRFNGLMKTPNTYYKNGFFVPISYTELVKLTLDPDLKSDLTKEKRSLDYYIPGQISPTFTEIYQKARKKVLDEARNGSIRTPETDPQQLTPSGHQELGKVLPIRRQPKCIERILNSPIEKGSRNSALLTVAIHFKNKGQDQKQVESLLLELSSKWNYDEKPETVKAVAKSVFHNNTRFSCKDGARKRLCFVDDDFCNDCPYKKGNQTDEKNYTRFKIQRTIINELWQNDASLRHYIAYLELSRKNLYNHWFSLETVNFTERTIRELCNKSRNLIFSKNGESVMIYNKAAGARDGYHLIPNEFYDNRVYGKMDHHLKHYLKLLGTGYQVEKNGKSIKCKVGKKRIMELLDYKTEDAVYKLFQKLNIIGLARFKDGKLYAIYYESYKVIDIKGYKASKEATKPIFLQGVEMVAGGETLFISDKQHVKNRGAPSRGSPNTG